jgi:hypothetical protein
MVGNSNRQLCIAVGVPVIAALLVFLPSTLSAFWLSDDFAYASLLTPNGTASKLEWSEVIRQLHDRWLFSYAYWRPLVTLTGAINFLVAPDSVGFALVNLTLHLLATIAVALSCARLCDGPHAALAGAVGGLSFATHPLAGESVLWISARVSTLEVACGAWSLWFFVRHVTDPRRHSIAPAALAFAAALLSKESAVVLPIAFLAIEALHATTASTTVGIRTRVTRLAKLAVVWIGYLMVRTLLLGSVGGGDLPPLDAFEVVARAGEKLAVVLGASQPIAIAGAVALVVSFALAIAAHRLRRYFVDILVTTTWALLALTPAFAHALDPDLVGARLCYAALMPVAILVARGLGSHRLGVLVAVGLVVSALPTTFAIAQRYRDAYATTREYVHGIANHRPLEPTRTDAAPLAVLSAPRARGVSGVIHPTTAFALGEPPFAPHARTVLAFGGLLAPTPSTLDTDPLTPNLFGDPSPIHALLQFGGAIAYWSPRDRKLAWIERGTAPADPLTLDASGRVTFAAGRGLLDAEVVILETSVDATSGRLVWITTQGEFDGPAALPLPPPVFRDGVHEFVVDLTRHAPLLVGATAGVEWTGLRVVLDAGVVRLLRCFPVLPELADVPRTAGRTIPLSDLPRSLQLPEQPFAGARELVLCTPSALYAIAVEPSGYPNFTTWLLDDLRSHLGALRGERVFWFARAHGRRSPMDSFVLSPR